MVKLIEPYVSQYVPQQFPDFYREEGPHFVAFLRAYYEWQEEADNNLYTGRRLLTYRDIDETLESFLEHWVKKYMHGLPTEQLGDIRFLQKHVLDVYRSKGSVAGLRLLFRLLYREKIDVYIPSVDMLKASDGTWYQPKYLEVELSAENAGFYQKRIHGVDSGATAIVEDYIVRNVRGRPAYLFYLSNIEDDFQLGEYVYYDGIGQLDGPKIRGSLTSVDVIESATDLSVGDKFKAFDDQGSGIGAEFRVKTIRREGDSGVIVFSISDGGFGYTLGAEVEVLSQSLLTEDGESLLTEDEEFLDSIQDGSGATFLVGSISNVSIIEYSSALLLPYDDDLFVDVTFLNEGAIIVDPTNTDHLFTEADDALLWESPAGVVINDDVLIIDWEDTQTVEAGTIATLTAENPGIGYLGPTSVIVTDPIIFPLLIPDGLGGYYGDDAVIMGLAILAQNTATAMAVFDSGFGYEEGDELLSFYSENNILKTEADETLVTEDGDVLFWDQDDEKEITLIGHVGAMGHGAGTWTTTRGFLNSDKYLQDSYYYQEYSYDVRSSRELANYEDVLRKVYHPVGVELFGSILNTMKSDTLLEVEGSFANGA